MWSIGIYTGASPLELRPAVVVVNPILTREDVHDVPARFVADPFMVRRDGVWYMFFEVLNQTTDRGEIGLATGSDGFSWTYQQIVIAEPFHLSYPYVFEWRGEYYMVPETLGAQAVRLYRAETFPTRWSCVASLVAGSCADPSIFRRDDKWWMFACTTPYQHDTLRLYFAAELLGPWREHPANPIVSGNRRNARPAGRVLISDGKLIRFSQDCVPAYGTQVRAFEILELTTTTYVEEELRCSPVLGASGAGWNAAGMHHVDAHLCEDDSWIACVDGRAVMSESGDSGHVPI
jgi:hypothetical protein